MRRSRRVVYTFNESYYSGAFAFVLAFILQLPFVYNGVAGGDSGELVAEACVFGVAHPPGYPLFVLLNGLLIHMMSYYEPALVANICSFLCGSIASAFIAMSIHMLVMEETLKNTISSIVGGVSFTLSPLVLLYSVGAEVFSLNNMICSILVYLVIRIEKDEKHRSYFVKWGSFWSGLGISNQHTCILFEIPLIMYVVFVVDGPVQLRKLLSSGFCFTAGLLPYLHLFIAKPSAGSWGDTSSFSGFFRHFTRAEYGTFSLSPKKSDEVENMMERHGAYLHDVMTEQLPLGLCVLACIGVYYTVKSRLGKLLVFTWGFYLTVFHSLANLSLSSPMPREVHRRFWIQPHIIVCVFFGVALHKLSNKYVLPIVVAILVGNVFTHHRVDSTIVSSYGIGIMNSLPDHSLVLSHTDINWNTLRYMQQCTGMKKSVTHLSLQLLPFPWFRTRQRSLYPEVSFPDVFKNASTERASKQNADMLVRLIRLNFHNFPGGVYVDLHAVNDADIGADNMYASEVYLIPHGVLWRVSTTKEMDDILTWSNDSAIVLEEIHIGYVAQPAGTWEHAAQSIKYDGVYQRALFLLVKGLGLMKAGSVDSVDVLLQATEGLVQVLTMIQQNNEYPTISVPIADVSRNGALASWRLLQLTKVIQRINPNIAKEYALICMKAFKLYGDPKDSFYQTIVSVLAKI